MNSVIDTYELSPMQAGMLFHAVSGRDPGIDIEQVVATLLDGRSYPLVLREVFAFYEASLHGKDVDIPLPRPYRDHIEWLRKLDCGTAKSYWQSVLSGFRAPTPLVVALDREAEHVTGGVW